MSAPPRHALVTGGAGFIGSRLTRALLDRGLGVTVLDDLSMGRRDRVDPRATFVLGDVRQRDAVERALKGVDAVFHLAARVTIRGSADEYIDDADRNLMGTLSLVRSIDPSRVRHMTFASSMAVYGEGRPGTAVGEDHVQEPLSPYGVSKWAAERIARQVLEPLGVRFTALRFFNTFGPGQTYTPYVGVVTIFVTRLLSGKPPVILGDGEQTRDFVHVDDIVAGVIASLDGPPGTYNLGSGRGTTVNEVAALLIARLAPGLVAARAPANAGELRYSVADIGRARSALGYAPTRSLQTHVAEVIEHVRGQRP